MKSSYIRFIFLLAAICMLGTIGFAQDKNKNKAKDYKKEFCSSSNWYNDGKVSAKDLREVVVPRRDINVDAKNGRIIVVGENRNDVLIRACVSGWGETKAEAESLVRNIRVETSGDIRADVPDKSNTSVAFQIHVPLVTNLDLTTGNGRITISDVEGRIRFRSSNGRLTLTNLAGDVAGETINGRVTVKLEGDSWRGSGMDVNTRNGRIGLYMPNSYAANVEVGTNNGRFSSTFDQLQTERDANGKRKRYGANRVNAAINGGGPPVKLLTRNGRVSIHSN